MSFCDIGLLIKYLPFSAGFGFEDNYINFEAMAVGRPTLYDDQTVSKVWEYLEACVDETVDVKTGESEKFTTYKQKTVVKLPTVEGLAVFLKVHRDTLHQWAKDHAEFSDVYNMLKQIQAERLINMSLSGDYNALISKMLLVKHGYVERQEVTGADGKSIVTETHVKIIRDTASKPTPSDTSSEPAVNS